MPAVMDQVEDSLGQLESNYENILCATTLQTGRLNILRDNSSIVLQGVL